MATKGLRLPNLDKRVWILFAGMALNQFGTSILMPFVSICIYVYEGVPATWVGFAIGPLIGGFLLDGFRGSPGVVWIVVGLAGLLCATGFIYLRKLVPPEKNTAMLVEA